MCFFLHSSLSRITFCIKSIIHKINHAILLKLVVRLINYVWKATIAKKVQVLELWSKFWSIGLIKCTSNCLVLWQFIKHLPSLHHMNSNCILNLTFLCASHLQSGFEKQPCCTRKWTFQNDFVIEIPEDTKPAMLLT